ncbi:hypothetical protein GOB57_09795 [Sinorhizobium meliloti]|nr:hypothetical protein [Sinorhizobium meliloti]
MDLDHVARHWTLKLDEISKETGIDRWRIEEAFAYGACATLALAVAEHRGLPISVVGTEGSYSHAFCVVGPGYGLDIWGVRSFQEILSMWIDDDPDCRIRPVTADELRSMGGSHLAFEFADLPTRIAKDACIAGAALDEFTITEFNCGACGDFAAALHDLTGWPIKAEFHPNGDIEHVWVVNPEGRAVDVNGIHQDDMPVTPYSAPVRARTAWLPRNEASSNSRFAEQNRKWAKALLNRYPEMFGLAGCKPAASALSVP